MEHWTSPGSSTTSNEIHVSQLFFSASSRSRRGCEKQIQLQASSWLPCSFLEMPRF